MKISNNWLKDYIKTELKPEKTADYLTDIGLEVEGIETFENITGGLEGIVVGKVLTCEKHPNADKLSITTVDTGGEPLQIVCGAPDVAAGQTVPVAVDRKSTRLNSSHVKISYAVFCWKSEAH